MSPESIQSDARFEVIENARKAIEKYQVYKSEYSQSCCHTQSDISIEDEAQPSKAVPTPKDEFGQTSRTEQSVKASRHIY